MIEYKGYFCSVNYNDEDEIFYGKVEYINSLISYEGNNVKSLKESFHQAVDDYLELCQNKGIEPEKPFIGNFNIQVSTELYRRSAMAAQHGKINFDQTDKTEI